MTDSKEIHEGSQFRLIAKHGIWYLAGSLLTKASGFLLFPLYTQYLSPTDYGIQSSLESIQRLLPIFISLYLDSAFGRYYFLEKKISSEKVKELYSTIFWFIMFWGFSVVALGLIIAPFTFQPLLEIPFLPFMPLAMIPPLLLQLSMLGKVFLRSTLEAKRLSLIELLVFLASTVVIVVLLVVYDMGIKARLYGNAIGSAVTLIYFVRFSMKNSLLVPFFKWGVLKRSLFYSLPLIPNIAAGWIASMSDRLILAYYGRMPEVGLYSLAAQLALVIYIINDAMTQVQGPISMSALTEDREAGKRQLSEFLTVYTWIILLCYLVITFFSKELLYFFTDEKFHSAYRMVAILAFVYVMSGYYRVFTTIISFHGKTWVISTAAILSALINMVLNFSLIPFYGQWAACWATFFSVLGYTVWIFLWAQRLDKVDIDGRTITTALLAAALLLCAQQGLEAVDYNWVLTAFLLKLFLVVLFIALPFIVPGLAEVRSKILCALLFRKL